MSDYPVTLLILHSLSFAHVFVTTTTQHFTFVNFHIAVGPLRACHHFAIIPQQKRIFIFSSETKPTLQSAGECCTHPKEEYRKYEIFHQHLLPVQYVLQLKFHPDT